MSPLWLVPLMLVLLLLKGFFSGSEMALVNADKSKLSHQARRGHRGAALVLRLFRTPEKLLTTTLVGTNIATITLTTLGTLAAIELLGNEFGDLWASLVLTPVLLILGEIVPKSVYQQRSEGLAPLVVYPLRAFYLLFLPIVFVFSFLARLAARLVAGRSQAPHLFATRQQLRTIMEVADRAKGIQGFDRMLIERAIHFPDATAGEAMIPLADLVTLSSEASTADAIKLARRHGITRLLVYEGGVSNIQGLVRLSPWDLLDPDLGARPLPELLRPAHFVAPQERLEDLLAVLRERDDQCAVVVDEYGSAAGLITVEQILEVVVGSLEVGWDFAGSHLRREPRHQDLGDGVHRFEGRYLVSQLNELLGVDFPASEFRTIGGFLTAQLGHVPQQGEEVVQGGYRFVAERTSPKAVISVRAEPT